MNALARGSYLALLLPVLLVGVADATDAVDVSSQPMIGEAAPGFSLSTIAGDSLSLGVLKGKYVVIHFGASW